MTLVDFVSRINEQTEISVEKFGPDKEAKSLAETFEKNKNEDISLLESKIDDKSSDNEILYIEIAKNVIQNKQYRFLQEENLFANVDAFSPYINSEKKELNQKWHILISCLAVLDISSFGDNCKNDNRFSNYDIGKITGIDLKKWLSISHEKKVKKKSC